MKLPRMAVSMWIISLRWRLFVFLTFNTALSIIINRGSRSSGEDVLFDVLITSLMYEDKEVEKEGASCFESENDNDDAHDNDGCNSLPDGIPDDDECKSASNGIEEDVDDEEDFFTQPLEDDLERRSEEFIERGRQRWRDEMERDRDRMKKK
ncbi:hypothetical protein Tco_1199820 [Tanacetum coccineum]